MRRTSSVSLNAAAVARFSKSHMRGEGRGEGCWSLLVVGG
jgi:hypothetical protein